MKMKAAVLREQGKPRPVPSLIPETPVECQRFEEAALRRQSRLDHAENLRVLRERAQAIKPL